MLGSFDYCSSILAPAREFLLPHVLIGGKTLVSLQGAVGIPPPSKQDKTWSILALVHYWICLMTTQLGNEIWFISFLPWTHWGFNQALGRSMIPGWAIGLYVGQAIKDTIQLPRPSPEIGVASFDSHYAGEYGLPSTHTTNSVVLAGSLIVDAYRYTATQEDFWWIAAPSISWIVLCPYSRLVLGAHYPLDLVAGGALGLLMLAFKLLAIDPAVEAFVLAGDPVVAAVAAILISILLVVLIPRPPFPAHVTTPGDTTTVLGVMLGCTLGYLLRREEQLQALDAPLTAPSVTELLGSVPLTLLGFGIAIGTKEAVRGVVRPLLLAVLGQRRAVQAGAPPAVAQGANEAHVQENGGERDVDGSDSNNSIQQASTGSSGGPERGNGESGPPAQAEAGRLLGPKERYEIELPEKLMTYTAVGFACVFVAPVVFSWLGLRGRYQADAADPLMSL